MLSPALGDFNEDLRTSASTHFGQRCGCSSHRRTSPASCIGDYGMRHSVGASARSSSAVVASILAGEAAPTAF